MDFTKRDPQNTGFDITGSQFKPPVSIQYGLHKVTQQRNKELLIDTY